MSEFKYDKNHLLDQTNGGLDVILRLYPEAMKGGKFEHFQLRFRNENTPSAKIIPLTKTNRIATVKDFGSGESYNCFDLVMAEERLEFSEACKWIAGEMNIDGLSVQFNRPKLEIIAAKEGQQDKEYYFEYNEQLSDYELEIIGPLITNETVKPFHLRSLKSFTQIKKYPEDVTKHSSKNTHKFAGKLTQVITKATEKYPILVFDFGDFKKIYQPLNKEKKYRFRFYGDLPKNYLVGLDSLEEKYHKKDFENQNLVKRKRSENESYEPSEKELDARFENIILFGGDRDALNGASLGYPVVWLNSEHCKLVWENYSRLQKIAKNICYVGDLDDTGVKQAVKLALDYIDIKMIWLPDWITNGSYRGKPRKDMTDFCKLVHSQNGEDSLRSTFKKLVKTSLPARFWEEIRDKNGNFKKYTFNSEACYRFLQYNGYYRYKEFYLKEDHTFIKVEDNIVDRVDLDEVKNYPGDYIRNTYRPISLLNFIHDTSKLSDKKLAKLQLKEPAFSNSGKDYQRLFFKNTVWTVTKDGIIQNSYSDIDSYVWKDNIIDKRVSVNSDKSFAIAKTANGYDIEIKAKNNHFLNYLINTSRVNWRICGNEPFQKRIQQLDRQESDYFTKEAEILKEREAYREANRFNIAEEGLSDEHIREQKQHLINKIYAIGYLLHTYKRMDRAWAVFAMDHKISDISDSNGGSGKSIMLSLAIPELLKSYVNVAGNDPEVYKDKHMLGKVTPQTDYLIFDDLDSHFPLRKVFTNITGEFAVRPIYVQGFNLKFRESPKVAFTSNFGLWNPQGSDLRRLLFTSFSDYYHHQTDDDFEAHMPRADFGKNLITEFDDHEYNDFVNFMAECIEFYLNTEEKIDPPMDHIRKRNDLQTMGDAFLDWADVFFNEKMNRDVPKNEAFSDFKHTTELKNWSPQRFKKSLKNWCDFHGYIFNPKELQTDKQGRIMSKYNGVTTEYIHIRSSHLKEDQQQTKREESTETIKEKTIFDDFKNL